MIALVSSTALLGGCVSGSETTAYQVDNQLVAISEITGAIKCALALSLQSERISGYPRLEGNVASIEYVFQVADTSTLGLNVNAEKAGPFVFAFSGGTGSILPKLGASVTKTNTVTTTIDATIGLHYRDTTVCNAIPARIRAGLGFEKWLSRSIEQLNVQARYSPYGVVNSLQLKTNFGVVKTANGGGSFDFVFLGGDASATQSRNDVQTIQMTLQPPSDKAKYPTVVVDGVTYGPPGSKKEGRKTGEPSKSKNVEKPPTVMFKLPKCSTPHGLGCFDVPPFIQ
jgi:hypothetical protein